MTAKANTLVERLWAATAHGDEEHRVWLREAYDAFFANRPVPAPRGRGKKEARILALEAEIQKLREALTICQEGHRKRLVARGRCRSCRCGHCRAHFNRTRTALGEGHD